MVQLFIAFCCLQGSLGFLKREIGAICRIFSKYLLFIDNRVCSIGPIDFFQIVCNCISPSGQPASKEAGVHLGKKLRGFLDGKVVEQYDAPRRYAAKSVVALLCRLAGNPTKLRDAVQQPDTAKLVQILTRPTQQGGGPKTLSSLAAAMWLVQ